VAGHVHRLHARDDFPAIAVEYYTVAVRKQVLLSVAAFLAVPSTALAADAVPKRKAIVTKTPWILPVYWIAVDYLSWSFKRSALPVSQTAGYPVLPFGANPEQNPKSSIRLTLGVGLDRFNLPGASAETSILWLARSSSFANPVAGSNATVSSGSLPPAFGVVQGPTSTAQSATGSGGVSGTFRTVLAGFEENLVQRFGGTAQFHGGDLEFSWLGGIRYLHLHDRVSLGGTINQTGSAVQPGTFVTGVFTSSDTFANEVGARNDFYGAQIGARVRKDWDRFFLQATGKIAVGLSHQELWVTGIHGQNFNGAVLFVAAIPVSYQQAFAGGMLSPAGDTRDRLASVSELNVSVGYRLTDHWELGFGYDLLYWSNVVRAGSASGTPIALAQFPTTPTGAALGPVSPGIIPTQQAAMAPAQATSFVAQGWNARLSYQFDPGASWAAPVVGKSLVTKAPWSSPSRRYLLRPRPRASSRAAGTRSYRINSEFVVYSRRLRSAWRLIPPKTGLGQNRSRLLRHMSASTGCGHASMGDYAWV
jgi:hypothetical protein